MDERLVAPGATTAVLLAVLGERTLLNWLTGPKAPWVTLTLVIVWNVAFVISSGSPYVYASRPMS
jgi:hypothetical protein